MSGCAVPPLDVEVSEQGLARLGGGRMPQWKCLLGSGQRERFRQGGGGNRPRDTWTQHSQDAEGSLHLTDVLFIW